MELSVKTIAHRGLCDIFPQNSLQSIEAGLFKADLVQFDVLLTKDDQLIVFHDRGLQRLTNISQFPEYSHRKRQNTLNGEIENDWWVNDFTLEQLKKLSITQTVVSRPRLRGLQFRIPSLQQVIRTSLSVKQNPKHPLPHSGLLIELKSYDQYIKNQKDEILVKETIKCFTEANLNTNQKLKQKKLPIILQSFSQQIMKYASKLIQIPLVRLFDSHQTLSYETLEAIKLQNMFGIGITQAHLKDDSIISLCNRMKMQVFYWTVKDDDIQLPFKLKNLAEVYNFLRKIGVKGIITEFPQNCRTICSNSASP